MFAVNPLGVQSDGALVETGRHQRQRLQQRGGAAGDGRPEPRLRLRVEGTAHRLRLRGRGPDSVQESPLPAGAGAELGHQRDPPGAALGRRGLLGAGQAGQRVVPGAVGAPRRAHRSAARAGARVQSVGHLEDHRRAGRERLGRTRAAAPSWAAACAGASPTTSTSTPPPTPTSRQVESDAGQFLFDPRNELFFSEKRPFFLDGIEQFTTPNSLIYTRRIVQPVARRQAHRQGLRHRHRAALRGGRSGRSPPTGDDHPVYNLLRLQRDVGRAVAARRGLHRPGRGQRLQPGGRRRRAAPLRRGVQRPAPAGRQPHPHRRRHDHGAALVRAVRPERPDLRLPLHRQRERSGLPRAERLLPASGAVPRQLRSAGDRCTASPGAWSRASPAT